MLCSPLGVYTFWATEYKLHFLNDVEENEEIVGFRIGADEARNILLGIDNRVNAQRL